MAEMTVNVQELAVGTRVEIISGVHGGAWGRVVECDTLTNLGTGQRWHTYRVQADCCGQTHEYLLWDLRSLTPAEVNDPALKSGACR